MNRTATLSKLVNDDNSWHSTQTCILTRRRTDRDVCETATPARHGTMLVVEDIHVRHASARWQHLVQKVGANIGLLSSSNCPCALGHSTRDLDTVVHGDDFIVAGDGDDLDWPSQKLNGKLELVQKARLAPGYESEATLLNRCVTYSDSGPTWEADPRHAELAVAELGLQSARPPQAVPSPVHHWTTRNWNPVGNKRVTACQQDRHVWQQTDLTSHSLERSAVVQLERQPLLSHA